MFLDICYLRWAKRGIVFMCRAVDAYPKALGI
ncbi:hypothetical protein PAND9192_02201 [Photobacterium andalusiense]|uniref:Uncharacterized protein n=1 Tax=Photobacterium andalusiense TaxID=2204296 RepID=A0A1Y6MG21_9GAMM|nr:hypothetical protein PAND9192_02201 [Photobacterium andalusiense]